ncbi:MAG: helix-turn-helix domain-containing protein, partial [Lysobacterales bacterium]
MEILNAVAVLASLAQETRLSAFRVLVAAGQDGLPAGEIAAQLGVPANTLSFHLKELAH